MSQDQRFEQMHNMIFQIAKDIGDLKGTTGEVLAQAKATNGRVTALEGRLEEQDKRLGSVEKSQASASGWAAGVGAVFGLLAALVGGVLEVAFARFVGGK